MGLLIDEQKWQKARAEEDKLREKLEKKSTANKELASELARGMVENLRKLSADHESAQEQVVVAERYVGELESRLEEIKYLHHGATIFGDGDLQKELQTEARDIRDRKLPQAREDEEVAHKALEESELDEAALYAEWSKYQRELTVYHAGGELAFNSTGADKAFSRELGLDPQTWWPSRLSELSKA